ncbi:unnamed protein product, partial [Staurois parvus]
YSECRVRGDWAGRLRGLRRPDIVNAGSGETGYRGFRVRGDRI